MFTKYSFLPLQAVLYIISDSTEFPLTRYTVFRLRRICFYQRSIFVLLFLFSIRYLAGELPNTVDSRYLDFDYLE